MLPHRLWRKSLTVFMCGMICLILWQTGVFPVLGQGNDGGGDHVDGAVKVVVQRGETLWGLAQSYHTTVDEIVKLNKVKSPDRISEGESLWIPTEAAKKSAVIVEETKNDASPDEKETALNSPSGALRAWRWRLSQIGTVFPGFSNVLSQKASIMTYEFYVNQEPAEPSLLAEPEVIQKQRTQITALSETESQVQSRGLGHAVSKEDVELLSRIIYAEARGESFEGQVAVGAVVLNRLEDPRFPQTIRDVIYQAGAFTAVTDKQIQLNPNDQAYKAAEAAVNGHDPTDGALFYFNPNLAKDEWIKSRAVVKRIGNHTFSI